MIQNGFLFGLEMVVSSKWLCILAIPADFIALSPLVDMLGHAQADFVTDWNFDNLFYLGWNNNDVMPRIFLLRCGALSSHLITVLTEYAIMLF